MYPWFNSSGCRLHRRSDLTRSCSPDARCGSARFNLPGLHAKLSNRMVFGSKVIDQVLVTGIPDGPMEAAAIYEVTEQGISKVRFVRG